MRPEQSGIYKAFAGAADGAMIADSQGRVVLWNPAAERLLGWSAREAVGRTCCEVLEGRGVDGGLLCGQACPVMTAARYGKAVEAYDLKAQSKDGLEVTLNLSTLSLESAGGLTGYLFRDVVARPLLAPRTTQASPTNGSAHLTPRELEVLRLIATGANTKTAAGQLGVSQATIRNHVQNFLGKLGVHSRLQAVAYATAHGLV
jgi:PAS domain S-box-containing protein